MRDRKLATRYARAMLSALPDPSEQVRADEFLSALAAGVRDSAPLRSYLLDPANPASGKDDVLRKLAESQAAPPKVLGLLSTIVANRRIANLGSIAEVFHEERERAQGVVSATLTSATPLTPELRERAQAALEKLSGRRVNLSIEVDGALLG